MWMPVIIGCGDILMDHSPRTSLVSTATHGTYQRVSPKVTTNDR